MTADYSGQLSVGERNALADALTRGLTDACAAIRLDSVARVRILLMLQDGSFGVRCTIGFLEGFQIGFLKGVSVWDEEFTAYLKIMGVGVKLGAAEFFFRPIVEEGEVAGLSPQTRAELERYRTLQLLVPVLQWLNAVGPVEAIETLREILPTAEDIFIMIGRAAQRWATTWLAELVATAPDAVAAGKHVGKLVGRVTLELVRNFLEPAPLSAELGLASAVSELESVP